MKHTRARLTDLPGQRIELPLIQIESRADNPMATAIYSRGQRSQAGSRGRRKARAQYLPFCNVPQRTEIRRPVGMTIQQISTQSVDKAHHRMPTRRQGKTSRISADTE
jgi:hypothetical protein